MEKGKKICWFIRKLGILILVSIRILFYCLRHPKKLFHLFFSFYSIANEFYQVSHGKLYNFDDTATAAALKQDMTFVRCNYFSADGSVIRPIEIQILSSITAYLKPRRVFEIGTYNGFTTLHFAYNSPDDCIVTSLDLPADFDIKNKSKLKEYSYDDLKVIQLSMENINKRVFKNDPLEVKITELFGDSRNFDFSPYYGKIDLVYIDGNHSYPYVKSDTEQAFKMLSENGVILWHDFDYIIHRDVFNYLNQLVKEYKIYSIAHTRFAIYGRTL